MKSRSDETIAVRFNSLLENLQKMPFLIVNRKPSFAITKKELRKIQQLFKADFKIGSFATKHSSDFFTPIYP